MKRPMMLVAAAVVGLAAARLAAAEQTVIRGISYYPPEALADADEYQRTRCVLDLSYPAGQTNFTTLVWIHSGGLVGGGKGFKPIRDPNIAQVAVEYRLLNATNVTRQVTGRDIIEDAAAAVAWTLKNIASYGGDPKRVFVSGSSAGGYLTMMVGMAPEYLAKWGCKPLDLAGIAPVTGQATKHYNVRNYSGDKLDQFQPVIDELAPLYHCRNWREIPPIVSICGEPPYEWKCRAEENRLLIASLTALGHPSALYLELPACNHGRCGFMATGYVELFILGRLPASYETKVEPNGKR